MLKKCKQCGETKEETTDFPKNGKHRDGTQQYRSYCKTCHAPQAGRAQARWKNKQMALCGYQMTRVEGRQLQHAIEMQALFRRYWPV